MSIEAICLGGKEFTNIVGNTATVTDGAVSFNQPWGERYGNATCYNVPTDRTYTCYGQATSGEGITYYYLSQDNDFQNVHGWVPSKFVKIGGGN